LVHGETFKTFATADTCVFAMHVHLVIITTSRHRVFDGDAIKRLRGMFSELAQRRIEQNAPRGEIGGAAINILKDYIRQQKPPH
jgi:REP element-mobilizing transposase RayT